MILREQLARFFEEHAFDRVIAHARQGRWHDAEEDLGDWEALSPGSPEIPLLRARIRFHQGRRQDAMQELEFAALAGADSALVCRMQAQLVEEDSQRICRFERRDAAREARRQFVGSMISRVSEFFSGISSRETAFLVAGLAFVAFVVFTNRSG